MRRLLAVLACMGFAAVCIGGDYDTNILVNARKAYLSGKSEADALETDREFTRYWKGIPSKYLEQVASDVRARRTEVSPWADLREYTGTWRVANVTTELTADGGVIYELLRFGLATTLPEDEARLVAATGDPRTALFGLHRFWPYVDPQSADTLIVGLVSVTNVAGPQADSQTYAGNFVVGKVWTTRNEDASTEIHQSMAKTAFVTNVTDLGRPIKNGDRTLLNYLQFNEGTNQGVWHVYQRIDPRRRDVALGLVPTESGHRIVKREFKTEDDGTGTLIVRFETNRWSNYSPGNYGKSTQIVAVANWDEKSDQAGIQRSVTKMIDGLDKVRAEATRNLIGADSGWFLDQVRLQEKDNGEFGIDYSQTKSRPVTNWVNTEFQAAYGREPEVETIRWHFQTETNAQLIVSDAKVNQAAMASSSYRAAPAGHFLNVVQKDPADNGSYTVTRRTWKVGGATIVWPQSNTEWSNSIYKVEYSTIGTNLFFRVEYFWRMKKAFSSYEDAETYLQQPSVTNSWRNAYVDTIGRQEFLGIKEKTYLSTGWYAIDLFGTGAGNCGHPKK